MCLRPQPIRFTNYPAILRLCMSYHFANMPLFSSLLGSSSAAPSLKPAVKRRASPLRESPVRKTDQKEMSHPSVSWRRSRTSNPHDPISRKNTRDMEQEDKNPPRLLLNKRPKSKAMPMQPSVPPLKLTPKIKAQPKNDTDEETESDNYQTNKADRPPLPRRPTMKVSPLDNSRWITDKYSRTGIMLWKEAINPGAFWNT